MCVVGGYNKSVYQVDVACGKHGAASGLSPGKGYLSFLVPVTSINILNIVTLFANVRQ